MIYNFDELKNVFNLPISALIFHAQEVNERFLIPNGILVLSATNKNNYAQNPLNNEEKIKKVVELLNETENPEIISLQSFFTNDEGLNVLGLTRLIALLRIVFPKSILSLNDLQKVLSPTELTLCIVAGVNALDLEENTEAILQALNLRAITIEEHHRKLHGCKGDGSCGGTGCKGDGSCGKHDHPHSH